MPCYCVAQHCLWDYTHWSEFQGQPRMNWSGGGQISCGLGHVTSGILFSIWQTDSLIYIMHKHWHLMFCFWLASFWTAMHDYSQNSELPCTSNTILWYWIWCHGRYHTLHDNYAALAISSWKAIFAIIHHTSCLNWTATGVTLHTYK